MAEKVVRHLGVGHWERVALDDEVDSLGPYAVAVLRRHGLLWPHNAHFHVPICQYARGGSVLTGVGGDELLLPSKWVRLNHVLARAAPPEPRDLARLVVAYGPRLGRRLRFAIRGGDMAMHWLRPRAARELARRLVEAEAAEAIGWDKWVRTSWWPARSRVVGGASLARLADDVGAVAIHPMEDGAFLATVAAARGRAGYPNRTTAMEELFGDVLPPDALNRRTKAFFDDVFWGPYSREFARSWAGRGSARRWSTSTCCGPCGRAGRGGRPAVAARPNFLIAGAAKSGTTSLYLALKEHPDVYMSPMKEPHYFAYLAAPDLIGDVYGSVDAAHREYEELFRGVGDETAIGEASTSTLLAPGAAEIIERALPDVRIVVVLRDPSTGPGRTSCTSPMPAGRRRRTSPGRWGRRTNACARGCRSPTATSGGALPPPARAVRRAVGARPGSGAPVRGPRGRPPGGAAGDL